MVVRHRAEVDRAVVDLDIRRGPLTLALSDVGRRSGSSSRMKSAMSAVAGSTWAGWGCEGAERSGPPGPDGAGGAAAATGAGWEPRGSRGGEPDVAAFAAWAALPLAAASASAASPFIGSAASSFVNHWTASSGRPLAGTDLGQDLEGDDVLGVEIEHLPEHRPGARYRLCWSIRQRPYTM